MARARERVFALTLAVLFFVFSFGLSFFVIWQLYKGNKEAKNVNQQSSTATDASASSNKEKNVDNSSQQPAQQLQGTKLQNFTPVSKIDALNTDDIKPGTGDVVKAGVTVTVDYTGAVASTGTIFQSSLDTGKPVSFGLDGVIKGWTEGVPGMKVGGTRRLYIPADLAYGANPPQGSGIPANADLVFDITLHSVTQ